MKRSTIIQSNVSTTLPGAVVVVVGGTQGIGEAVATRFARAGATVWIIGRNEVKANAILKNLAELSQQTQQTIKSEHLFIKADLSLVSEAKRVAEIVSDRAGPRGIDYLILSQGGQPNGTFLPTAEGHDQHYAVQVLSRFIFAYRLAGSPDSTVKRGVMSIMSPGFTLQPTDYDDLELLKAKAEGRYGMNAMYSRDSNIIDIVTQILADRNPKVIFTHVFPGYVNTNIVNNSAHVWYISLFMRCFLAIMGASAESYAEVPFYLLANPEGRSLTEHTQFWDEKVNPINPHFTARQKMNKDKVWAHLLQVGGLA
ncbi:hypothetical protein BU17DRAFT_73046 [Hysterangium stoloniferum]|nr:hypothetical protein BU17DRAFT_73046 [Hysterangium stoloniferum]